MKKYTVRPTPKFYNDLEIAINNIAKNSAQNARLVNDAVYNVALSLSEMPERFQYAREREVHNRLRNQNLRQAIVKNHRIIFLIQNDTVSILTIQHCRQKTIDREEI